VCKIIPAILLEFCEPKGFFPSLISIYTLKGNCERCVEWSDGKERETEIGVRIMVWIMEKIKIVLWINLLELVTKGLNYLHY
jgi:hypothetical protein